MIEPVTVKGKSPLAGNTVSMDRYNFCNFLVQVTALFDNNADTDQLSQRRFLEKYMPRLASHLHYRTVDVRKKLILRMRE